LSLKDRRGEYSWPKTRVDRVQVVTDKKTYALGDSIRASVAFRIVGGLREAFHPDVWTVAWEDFDKKLRLTTRMKLSAQGGLRPRKVGEIKKEVRMASFYWSRDPDLPYRIWVMIIPEDGGAPKIPRNVEDAKSEMLDVEKEFTFPASELGMGTHNLVAEATGKWGRRSFIEKGEASSKSKPAVVKVE
jgi:hypothetical protein